MSTTTVCSIRDERGQMRIRRRRQCLACKRRFTTREHVERSRILVIKKDGARVPFDRDKVREGLEKACWKRSISDAQIDNIVVEVENHVESNFEAEVESRHWGNS